MQKLELREASRQIVISKNLDFNAAGFTSRSIHTYDLLKLRVREWTHWYYIPGKVDWAEAKKKAEARVLIKPEFHPGF